MLASLPVLTGPAGWMALLGCGSAPEPISGRLLLVSEKGDEPHTRAVEVGQTIESRLLQQVPGQTFPGPPDPLGTDALIVAAETSDRGHRETLWRIPLDGGEPVRLAPSAGVIRNPSWAPDGSFVVFEADPFSYRDLFLAERAGGKEPRRLTSQDGGSFEPVVSPDGTRIAFGASRDGNAEIYVMKVDGTEPLRRTEHPRDDVRPAWVDAQTLAWLSHREGRPRVHLMAADGPPERGTRPLRVPTDGGLDLDHAWSPDGSKVAVTVQSGPKEVAIEIYDRQGNLLTRLDEPGVDEHPSWSPDGAWIAFSSAREGQPDIYIASADGARLRRVTDDPAPEWLPRWVPAPKPAAQ